MNRRNRIRANEIVYAKTSMNSIVYTMKKQTPWAKPGFVTDLTGWDGEKLRQAREQRLIKFEKRDDGFWYDLDSIPERLLKK